MSSIMTYFKSLIEIKSLYTRQCPLGSRFSGSVSIEVIPELGNFITIFTQSYVPVPSLLPDIPSFNGIFLHYFPYMYRPQNLMVTNFRLLCCYCECLFINPNHSTVLNIHIATIRLREIKDQ